MIEVPATDLQQDALREAAKLRNMSLGEYLLDSSMTTATIHLGRSLAEWVGLERQAVNSGKYKECGAVYKRGTIVRDSNGAEYQEERDSEPCCRVRGHENDAVAMRDAHVLIRPDGQYESWAV